MEAHRHEASAHTRTSAKPQLVFFFSPRSGRSRRVEGFLAQVLQRRRNHDTFDLLRVDVERRPDLSERFAVETVPTIVVIEDRRVRARVAGLSGAAQLERTLRPWLR